VHTSRVEPIFRALHIDAVRGSDALSGRRSTPGGKQRAPGRKKVK
jgi:hypothetical protein